jgi:hypothetical protein
LELYDLLADIGETRNVAVEHPEVVALLEDLADGMRLQLGDSLRGLEGTAVRPAGQSSQ